MIGASGWMIWSNRKRDGGRAALALFVIQLSLNFAWTPVFFGLQAPGAAFAVIAALLACIGFTIALTWRVHRAAAVLLCPYAAWVTFASALNLAIWRLN